MEIQTTLEGSCQCGAVRYRVTAQPDWVGHCHCRMCQKAHGAPLVSWVAVPAETVTFTKAEPKYFRSSEKTRRGFCADCGTPLVCIAEAQPGKQAYVDLALSTFDNPKAFVPKMHVWCDSAMPWLPIDDHLPRFGQGLDSNGMVASPTGFEPVLPT